MRYFLRFSGLILTFSIILICSCEKKEVPILSTSSITNITGTSATCGGTITDEGSGTIISRGVCWSTGPDPTIENSKTTDGAGAGSFISNLSSLSGGTTYYVRGYATNNVGTGYGMAMSFITLGQLPVSITSQVTNLTTTSATLNGSVNANYLSSVVSFEYGTTINYGQTVVATQSPVVGNTSIDVSANINGLSQGTTYHFRVKATNSLGSKNGNDLTFVTILSDGSGNIYTPIIIGSQVWTKENLKTTKYLNGEAIANIPDGNQWGTLIIGGYCSYNNSTSNTAIYGLLYNYYAVNDSRKICPSGWHIPTDAEWTTLTTYLGGESIAGGKMKETGTAHWLSPNTNSTNESAFTALPGGYRYADGSSFDVITLTGLWWSSTESTISSVWDRMLDYNSGSVNKSPANKNLALSVRCIKNN